MTIIHSFLLCVFLANWSSASAINNCLSNPCRNDGTCVNGDDRYTCICTHKFTGLNCNETCPASWTPFNGRCYRFFVFPKTWEIAQISCGHWGGTLVEITSAEVNAFLVSLRDRRRLPDKMDRDSSWIGLKYKDRKRNYVWDSSGKLANFTNWENGQQSNAPFEDCVTMLKAGEWTSSFCRHSRRPYFCDRPVKDFKYCSLEPCRNGGTCIDEKNNYKCSCRPEFTGANCEEFNNCHPNPCLNGATCEDRYNSYTCICTPEFTGYHCRKRCPSGWTMFDRLCYTLITSPANWFSAQSLCRKDGGDLAEITSDAENKFLVHLKNMANASDRNQSPREHYRLSNFITVESAWIGLNDQGNDTHVWVSSGKSAGFTNWYSGKPRDASSVKDCVEMKYTNGAWRDLDCGSSRPYLCERPLFEPCPALDFSVRSCYAEGNMITDWFSAQTSCRKGGGNLVEINSAAENKYLVDRMDVYLEYIAGPVWIGLKAEGNEDTPIWVQSGNTANFTNWEGDRTSNLSLLELCVLMTWQSGKWKHARCENAVKFICEYSNQSSYCFPDPCLNGATCIGMEDNYTCSCRPNVFGRNCEEFNSCSSNPCKNGGTCVDNGNYYICKCTDGFTGGNCMETCPAKWNFFAKSCYSFSDSPANWTTAQISCRNRGGNLAQITSAAENNFLVKLRDQAEVSVTSNAWIGLMMPKETTPARTWILSAGQVAKFTNWANGQPNGDGYCAEMWWSGKWNDLKCEKSKPYFCERSTIDAN